MIRNNPIRSVDAITVIVPKASLIRTCPGNLLNSGENRRAEIRVIGGALVLEDVDEAFGAEASVDVFRGERAKASIYLSIELNEHVVPYFYHAGIVPIHEVRRVAVSNAIEENFAWIRQLRRGCLRL